MHGTNKQSQSFNLIFCLVNVQRFDSFNYGWKRTKKIKRLKTKTEVRPTI